MPAYGHDAIAHRRHIVAAVITLDGVSLTPAALARVARGHEPVALDARRPASATRRRRAPWPSCWRAASRSTAPAPASARSAGRDASGDGQALRLLRSHAAGAGPLLGDDVVRAAMAARANQIGAGGAGVTPALLDALVAALNDGVTPPVHALRLARHRRPDGALRDRARAGRRDRARAARRPRVHERTPSPPGTRRCWPSTSRRSSTPGSRSRRSPSRRSGADRVVLDERLHARDAAPGQAAVAARMRELLHGAWTRERAPGYASVSTPTRSASCRRSTASTHEALSALERGRDRRAQPRRRERARGRRAARWRSPTATPTRRASPRRSTRCAARSRSRRR